MKNQLPLGLIAGLVLGAIASQEVQAQSSPPVYVIVQNEVLNQAAYVKEFVPVMNQGIKEHGGRIIAAGEVTPFLGTPPSAHAVIQRWDSMEQLEGWQNSQQFKDAIKIGQEYANFRTFAVKGLAE